MADKISMLDSFRPLLDADSYQRLQQELETSPDTCLRFNPLKVDPAAALLDLSRRFGWQTGPVSYCPTGVRVLSAQVPPGQTFDHQLGHYYIQEAASMLPAELFDFAPGSQPLILDMAASPGGKTTHLAARSEDQGLILANDSSASRLTALRLVLQTWGTLGTAVTGFPGEKFGAWYPGFFDAVLLDAPCSMQGLRSSASHPIRPITPREITGLAVRQARLLISALQAVRSGGQVVYSTCTLSPQEDEGVIDTLLRQYPGAFEVDDISTRLPKPAPGLPGDGNMTYQPAVQRAARLWPHLYSTAGFFTARLTRLSSIPGRAQKPPGRPLQQAGFLPLRRSEAQQLHDRLQDAYGFDLNTAAENHRLALWRRGSVIHAFPEQYLQHFETFPCQALGLPLAEETPDGLLLSHEWVGRFFQELTGGRLALPEPFVPGWLRGEDAAVQLQPTRPEMCFPIVTDPAGRLLGRGKTGAGGLKNLLPRRITSSRLVHVP